MSERSFQKPLVIALLSLILPVVGIGWVIATSPQVSVTDFAEQVLASRNVLKGFLVHWAVYLALAVGAVVLVRWRKLAWLLAMILCLQFTAMIILCLFVSSWVAKFAVGG